MNEAEDNRRAMMGRPVPARPKNAGPTPPPLDELMAQRKSMRDPPTRLQFSAPVENESMDAAPEALESMRIIARELRKYPKPTRRAIVGFIAEMLLEN
jgi:hypothetical protein